MNKIRQVSLLKRGTIGIIFNWCPPKYSITVQHDSFDLTEYSKNYCRSSVINVTGQLLTF